MSKSAILCVDDEVEILRCLKEQLKRAFGQRYLYEFAQSVEEALIVINELQADEIKILIVVSDWLMPGIRGDEFLIQVHQQFPDIITVMLTGQADEAATARARQEANLYACLSKPWKESDLKKIITTALN